MPTTYDYIDKVTRENETRDIHDTGARASIVAETSRATEAEETKVPKTTTVNGKELSTDVVLDAGDINVDDTAESPVTVQAKLTEQSSRIATKDLVDETVFNTTQELVTNDSGQVARILHKRNGATYRSDEFTYGTDSITEERTITSIGTLTIVTNLTTLATTVTFVAA